ncbi:MULTISPECIES: response regulator transcription factor [unclassified Micromonospora]|jgi:DNA-binding NarL/FixJ family response regulator|uniref:response regulator n=1 Tax=unclassified Micromonospora TaxID=2617518 RepID=UPI0010351AB3|nr:MULTISPECIES: response regulator transcription factor [unclassified Micromonospora]QKW14241.1 response regulator transcription factor [Verrucosispora sp. NA02020]TBL27163.1 response regulator transcription factor [Verrucosispora sp. SN26_14.1]
MIDVLIVDDNPIVRTAIRGYLASAEDVRVVGEAPDGRTAVTVATRLRPTVTLLDHRMPIADGLSVVDQLAQQTSVLVLTSDSDDELIAGMLRGGASGYLVHGEFDPAELLRAVHAVAAGQGWLSPRGASVTIAVLREQANRERDTVGRAEQIRRMRQEFGLTRREQEVVELLGAGHSNAAIARRLLLTEKTVKNHLNHIFAKLRVTNRTEAVVRWSGPDGTPIR